MASSEAIAAAAAARLANSVPATAAPLTHLPLDPVVLDAKRRFNLAMEDELLDYKHNHPVNIDNCANTLLKIFNNVLNNPEEPKFRQVKAVSNAFKNNVANIKGGEHLMTLAGWRTNVVDLQKFYVFDGEAGSHKFLILQEASLCLQKALATIHEKAERKRREGEEKAAAEKARRDAILLALEDDKLDRRIRSEVTAVQGPVVATALPTADRPSAGQGGAGQEAEEEEEEGA